MGYKWVITYANGGQEYTVNVFAWTIRQALDLADDVAIPKSFPVKVECKWYNAE